MVCILLPASRRPAAEDFSPHSAAASVIIPEYLE